MASGHGPRLDAAIHYPTSTCPCNAGHGDAFAYAILAWTVIGSTHAEAQCAQSRRHQREIRICRGHSIDTTLSMLDLFSFDVARGSRLRMNLEELVHKN
jgi:hypothetical protein